MDYEKIYSQLIERSQSENRKKGCGIYFERHHIVKHSDETKKKMSLAQSNKTISDETKKKISATLLGYTHSDETKQQMKNSAINKPFIKCPHCLLQSKSKGNMNRYHFNNCKTMEINNGRL